ncbi:hypothetical protein QQ045_007959 [Rhodiola kirilowii]
MELFMGWRYVLSQQSMKRRSFSLLICKKRFMAMGTYSDCRSLHTKQDDKYLSLITISDDFVDVWVMLAGCSWVRQARVGPSVSNGTEDYFGKFMVWRMGG